MFKSTVCYFGDLEIYTIAFYTYDIIIAMGNVVPNVILALCLVVFTYQIYFSCWNVKQLHVAIVRKQHRQTTKSNWHAVMVVSSAKM